MIAIAILEDDLLMQARLERVLKSWHFARDVYAVDSNLEFSKIATEIQFDIALVDISVSDGSGIDSIRLLRRTQPKCKSIIVSSNSNPNAILESIKAGAIGFIYKDDSRLEIIQAIQSALDGAAPISSGIAFTILKSIQDAEQASSADLKEKAAHNLTKREIEIIELISKGMSNNEVAKLLGLSQNTIPVHVKNIYKKLGTSRRTEAVFEARQIGVIK